MSWKLKYNIEYKGLKEGLHDYEYEIKDTFFDHFEESLIDKGEVHVKITLEKRSAFLKILMKLEGWLELTCDRCLENYKQNIANEAELFVKFGEKDFEEGEDVIWVLPQEHHINVAQIIYEYISLSIPLKQVHEENENGDPGCDPEMLNKLELHLHPEEEEEKETDPRWEALKKIRNNN